MLRKQPAMWLLLFPIIELVLFSATIRLLSLWFLEEIHHELRRYELLSFLAIEPVALPPLIADDSGKRPSVQVFRISKVCSILA